jgi:hypothetical protein
MERKINFKQAIGTHTLLYGGANTKKTYYTAQFIEFLIITEHIKPSSISILDFAPPLNMIGTIKFGGKIKDFSKISLKCKNLPIRKEIIPPRFSAQDKKELYEYLCHNYKITHKALNIFKKNPTKFLVINDLSLYLHLGNKRYLLDIIKSVNTFFGNTYYGGEIKSTFNKLLSIKERKRVDFLVKHLENVIFTS